MKLTSKNLKSLIREMMSEMAGDDYYRPNPLASREPYQPHAPRRPQPYQPPPERSMEQKEAAARKGAEGWAQAMRGFMSPEQLEIEKEKVYQHLLHNVA